MGSEKICVVARAVALGCDVSVLRQGHASTNVWEVTVESVTSGLGYQDFSKSVHVRSSDVPATLARLLDEVEASRKAVQK
jgi:hypothetical protein